MWDEFSSGDSPGRPLMLLGICAARDRQQKLPWEVLSLPLAMIDDGMLWCHWLIDSVFSGFGRYRVDPWAECWYSRVKEDAGLQ